MVRLIQLAAALLLVLPLAAQQQESPAPPPQQNPPASKPEPAKKPSQTQAQPQKKLSEAEQNPFPEAQSEAAAHQTPGQPSDKAPATPSAPQPQSTTGQDKPSSADESPAAQPQKAADQDQKQSAPAATPGNSGQDYSSSQSGLKDFAPPGETAAKGADEGDGTTSNPGLARQDTQVGVFYLQTHDYQGAYVRFAEASRIDPGNADAVFGLAESERHLNRRDDAIRNYQLYLSALPNGPHAKEARRELKEMGVQGGS